MEISLSLGELFLKSFGYKTDAYDNAFKKVTGDVNLQRAENGKHGSPYYVNDVLGREVYLPIEVQVGHDTIRDTNTSYAEALGVQDSSGAFTGRWFLPYPVMSAAELKVKVIETELTERPGMVSELINLSGYKVEVKGFLINANNELPEADYDTLSRLAAMKIPVRVNNVVTDMLYANLFVTEPGADVQNLWTIRNVRFTKRSGVKHVVPYELELWSEIPFNLVDIS